GSDRALHRASRQGPRVAIGLRDLGGGEPLPVDHGTEGRGRRGGGAPPLLRRRHPRKGRALPRLPEPRDPPRRPDESPEAVALPPGARPAASLRSLAARGRLPAAPTGETMSTPRRIPKIRLKDLDWKIVVLLVIL